MELIILLTSFLRQWQHRLPGSWDSPIWPTVDRQRPAFELALSATQDAHTCTLAVPVPSLDEGGGQH